MRALRYAIRPFPVLKYFGQLCVILSLLTLVPLFLSLLFGDYNISLRYGIIVVVIFIMGFYLRKLPTPKQVQTNEAMVITAIVFLFTALVMTWPFMGSGLSFLDAFFESVSGVTTTGLSVTASVADKPSTFLFSRAWMQWVGGLGIVVLSLAVMVQPLLAAKRIGITEDYQEDVFTSGGLYARRTLIFYVVLTCGGIIVLGLIGSGWSNAVLYSLAAVSTGGFSPHDNSLGAFSSPWIQIVVILLALAAAFPLILYYRAFRKGWLKVFTDLQLRSLMISGAVIALFLVLSLWLQEHFSWSQALLHGSLNAFSAQSTAGFASIDISHLNAGAKAVLIFAMILGGSAGSTAGGIKILRLLILIRLFYLLVQRAGMPKQAIAIATLSGRRIEADEIQNALGIFLVFLGLTAVSWLAFTVMGYDPLNALFDVVSAVSTTGLSAGITGPELHPVLKGVLCVDMLMGRVEILAWLILFYPGSWIGRRLEE